MAQRQFRSDDTDKWLYGFGNGSDGDLVISGNTTDAPIDSSCSGTAGQTSLSATNVAFAAGQLILIHQSRGIGAGAWELNKILSYTAGTITLKHALMNTYTDSGASQAQVLVMKQYNNVTVNTGVTWTAKAWDKNVGGILAYFAKGTVTITGSISAVGCGYVGGVGSGNVGNSSYAGESNLGDAGGTSSSDNRPANGISGGGGYDNNPGSNPTGGGGGGHASTGGGGQAASGSGGAGGAAIGLATLTTLFFGGSGGGCKQDGTAPNGGRGGGIVLVIGKNITVTGSILTTGGAGAVSSSGYSTTVTAGSGAGGSVLLKSQILVLGTNLVTAIAGTVASASKPGGVGSVGRIHADYKTSISGTTNPTIDATQDATIHDVLMSSAALLMLL